MEMPTPCYYCAETVELNDMNTCSMCDQMCCSDCCKKPWGGCEYCQQTYTCEYTPERGKNADTECGKYAPNKIDDTRCCNRHFAIIERKLGLR